MPCRETSQGGVRCVRAVELFELFELCRAPACAANGRAGNWSHTQSSRNRLDAKSDPPVRPIVAGSRPEQLAENMEALGVTLTTEQMTRLYEAGNPAIQQAWLR